MCTFACVCMDSFDSRPSQTWNTGEGLELVHESLESWFCPLSTTWRLQRGFGQVWQLPYTYHKLKRYEGSLKANYWDTLSLIYIYHTVLDFLSLQPLGPHIDAISKAWEDRGVVSWMLGKPLRRRNGIDFCWSGGLWGKARYPVESSLNLLDISAKLILNS